MLNFFLILLFSAAINAQTRTVVISFDETPESRARAMAFHQEILQDPRTTLYDFNVLMIKRTSSDICDSDFNQNVNDSTFFSAGFTQNPRCEQFPVFTLTYPFSDILDGIAETLPDRACDLGNSQGPIPDLDPIRLAVLQSMAENPRQVPQDNTVQPPKPARTGW